MLSMSTRGQIIQQSECYLLLIGLSIGMDVLHPTRLANHHHTWSNVSRDNSAQDGWKIVNIIGDVGRRDDILSSLMVFMYRLTKRTFPLVVYTIIWFIYYVTSIIIHIFIV